MIKKFLFLDCFERFFLGIKKNRAELSWRSPQFFLALRASVACVLAIFLAIYTQAQDPFWSGISAMTVMVSTQAGSFRKGALRISGTLIGALIALICVSLFIQQPLMLCLCLFFISVIGIYGSLIDPDRMYAWLMGYISALMVILMPLGEHATGNNFINVAFYRSYEVILGALAAFLIQIIFAPKNLKSSSPLCPSISSSGLSLPQGERRNQEKLNFLKFALISTCGILIGPLLWTFFALPGFSQIAVSIGAVLSMDVEGTRYKGFLRILGCAVGALFVFIFVGLGINNIFIFLILLFLISIFFLYFHFSDVQISYFGTQGLVVFYIGVAAGLTPETSLTSTIERLIGIIGGVCFIVIFLSCFWNNKKAVNKDLEKVLEIDLEKNSGGI